MRWRQGNMARTLLVGACACLVLALASAAGAQDPPKDPGSRKEYPLNIDQQPLTRALEQLYEQIGVLYGYSPNTTEEEQMLVGPLKGKYTIEDALTQLLRSTGLTHPWTNSTTTPLLPPPPAPHAPPAPPASTEGAAGAAGQDIAQRADGRVANDVAGAAGQRRSAVHGHHGASEGEAAG